MAVNYGEGGKGRPAGEANAWQAGHLQSRAGGTGPTGGAFGEASTEIENLIAQATQGKSKVSDLLEVLGGTGKTKVSNFTGAIKSLNTEMKRAVDLLKQATDLAGNMPAGLGGGVGSSGNGGDVRFTDPQRTNADAERDRAGAGPAPRGPRENGGVGWQTSLKVAGGVGSAGILAAGASLRRQHDPAAFFDTLTRQQVVYGGGTAQGWSQQYSEMFRGQGAALGGAAGFATMDAAMRAGGVQRGTQSYSNITRGVAGASWGMPGTDVGTLAGTATALQHGSVAMGLRQRGITTFDDDFPAQMRKIMRAALGGRKPTEEIMAVTRPGTAVYDNLMALLGDDPAMVAQVIEWNRADAKGRSMGADITTQAGATRMGLGTESIETSEAMKESSTSARAVTDKLDILNDSFTDMAERSRNFNEALARLPHGVHNFVTELGELTNSLQQGLGLSGMGGLGNMIASYIGARGLGALGGGGRGGPTSTTGPRGPGVGPRGAGRLLPGLGLATAAYTAAEVTSWMQESGNELLQAIGTTVDRTAPGLGGINQIRGWLGLHTPEPAGGLGSYVGGIVQGGDHNSRGISRKGFGGVKPHVAAAGHYIDKKFGPFPGGIGGVGQRAGKSDHPSGLALDFMTNNNMSLGDRVARFMAQNAKHFGVKYVIWKQQINEGAGWKPMEDRGNPTANHMDHPHVSFYASPDQGKEFVDDGFSGGSPEGGSGEWRSTADAADRRASGASMGGRSELEIFNSFFGGGGGPRSTSGTSGSRTGFSTGEADDFTISGGGRGGIDAFMSAIMAQESGGRSQVANDRTGAHGLFQIMPGNWAPWAREAGLGANAAKSAANQTRVARFKMQQYYDKYGSWDLVAAAWFGGPGAANALQKGDTSVLNRSDGNMTIGEYIQKARRGMAASSQEAEPRGGREYSGSSVSVAPAGGLDSAPPAGSSMPSGGGAVRGSARVGGGSGPVNITVKVERATYSEAEKFTGWVVDMLERRNGLAKIGGR